MVNWLNIEQTAGTGNSLIVVSADTNTTGNIRSTSLVLSGNTKSLLIPVHQNTNTIVLDPNTWSFDYIGGSTSFWVYSNTSWEVVSYPSWVNLLVTSAPSIDHYEYIKVFPNLTSGPRTGTIVFSAEGTQATFTITQGYNQNPSTGTPFTIEVISAGTLGIGYYQYGDKNSMVYSYNNGSWTIFPYTERGIELNVVPGDTIRLMGNNEERAPGGGYINLVSFGGTCHYNVSGNIMSLLYYDYDSQTMFPYGYEDAFVRLFYNQQNLHQASGLTMPCQGFYGYGDHTYGEDGMFEDCTNLETPPQLPPSTWSDFCRMFQGCTALTTAPVLTSSTLTTPGCYKWMFYGCKNINYIKCLAVDGIGPGYTDDWLLDVAPTGTFVKAAAAVWPRGGDGIPEGWTVINE